MNLGTRLVLGLSLVVAVVMGIYGASSLRQRAGLVAATIERETAALALALEAVANDATPADAPRELDPVLRRVLEGEDVSVAALTDQDGRVVSGGPPALPPCVASVVAQRPAALLEQWTRCPGGRQLVVVAPRRDGGALVLTRGAALIDRDLAATRRRILLTTLALAGLASLAILVVLRLALTRPLARIMEGVRATGGPLPPAPIPVPPPREARELRELALAFNEMVERLEGKRRSLAQEVEERIELDRRLRMAESFAALGRLTGGVAHELGSPLGVIGVRAEAIMADAGVGDSSRRHAAEISREVDRIARLVRDLIHVSRRHGPGTDTVDVGALVGALIEELRPRAEACGIRLKSTLPAETEPVTVLGDPTLLRHALYHVMLNAMQALEEHRGERRLEVDVHRAGEVVRIAVSDSGPGVAAEDLPHLFEPFFTTRDVGEGSGLGLSISAGIAEEHGGALTVVPGPGGGVRAFFDLPAAADGAGGSA